MSEKQRGAEAEEAPASCKECKRFKDARENAREARLLEVIGDTITKIEEAIKGPGFKPSVGDYMKLVQMEKELNLADEDAKEIRVTWVEPTESEIEA